MSITLSLFRAAFPDERALRGALHDLIMRMPNVTSVQVTHGSQETGKDLVFSSSGPLGELVYSACVVKNTPISGSSSATTGASTVLNQVRQALASPIIARDGTEQRIWRVYIMSPSPISQTALRSINDQMKYSAGQIIFFCGADLLTLFELYHPQFLLLGSGLLTSYLELLRKGFTDKEVFQRLAFRHGMLATAKLETTRAYVKPLFSATLREVEFLFDEGDLNIFHDRGVNAREMEEACRFLHKTRDLLKYCVKSDEFPHTELKSKLKQVVRGLDKTATKIRQTWENGREKQSTDRHLVAIDLRALRTPVVNMVQRAKLCCEEIRKAVRDAIRQMTQETTPLNLLVNKEYRFYGVVREMTKLPSDIYRLGKSVRVVNFVDDFVSDLRLPILITAPAGYGKTSFCKWSALDDAEHFAKGKSEVIPVYIPVHRFALSVPPGFADAFLSDETVHSLIRDYKKAHLKPPVVRIYLDGLDEIPHDHQKALISVARKGMDEELQTHIVVTARDHVFGEWLAGFVRINIEPLDTEKVTALVVQLLGNRTERTEEFFRQLSGVPSLHPMMRIPLLATLVVALFEGMLKLPEGRAELYRIFVDLLCGGWDLAKGLRRESSHSSSDKQRILTRLASKLHHGRKREADAKMIRQIIREVAADNLKNWEGFLADLVQDGLVVREGSSYLFSHLSFQEYLCARDLADPGSENATSVLSEYLGGDDWWFEVVSFYVAMSTKPDALERNLSRLAQGDQAKKVRVGTLMNVVRGEVGGFAPMFSENPQPLQFNFPKVS